MTGHDEGAQQPPTAAQTATRTITYSDFMVARDMLRELVGNQFSGESAAYAITKRFDRLLWVIAKGDPLDDAIAELAAALENLEHTLRAQPEAEHTVPTQRAEDTVAINDLLREITTLTQSLRAAHEDNAATTQTLERERAQRTERDQLALDGLRSTTAAMRDEGAQVAGSIARLTHLTATIAGAHEALQSTIAGMHTAAHGADTPVGILEQMRLETAARARERWCMDAHDRIAEIDEAMAAHHSERDVLQAKQRTRRLDADGLARLGWLEARIAQLEVTASSVQHLVKPIQKEGTRIRERLHAMGQLAEQLPLAEHLPALPLFPEELPEDARVAEAPAPERATQPTSDAGTGDDEPLREPTPEDILAVKLTAVLIERCAQVNEARTGKTWLRTTIGKVQRCAHTSGILAAHGLQRKQFMLAVVGLPTRALVDRYLAWKGSMGRNVISSCYTRTTEPLPDEWKTLLREEEILAFLDVFYTPREQP
ncbi:MAG: hypothetical protein Q7S96_04790 [bacterium]|nr:hypothetical protein [bacterium]